MVLTFDSTTSEIWLEVPIIDDDLCEENETIDLMLTTSNPDVKLAPATGEIIIIDDDGNVHVVCVSEWGLTFGSSTPKTILVLEAPRQTIEISFLNSTITPSRICAHSQAGFVLGMWLHSRVTHPQSAIYSAQ